MDLKNWADKNLVDEVKVPFSKIKVISQNKNGTLKLNADNHWVNYASINSIKEAQKDEVLHIVYRKKEEWKNAAWLTAYDWSLEEEKEEE
jgi:hypothetical protein